MSTLKKVSSSEDIFSKIAEIQEKERKRTAFDLHDGPAQSLSSALLQIGIMEELVETDDLKKEYIELKEILKSALEELHNIIHQLYPRCLTSKELIPKVKCYIEEFKVRTGINVNLKIVGEERGLTSSAQIAIFRVIQEALNNVHKHADADGVDVELCLKRKEIECSVIDNGKGFLVEEAIESMPETDCFGLMGMHERVGLINGTLDIVSEPGKGTKIKVKVPIWEPKSEREPDGQGQSGCS